MWFSVMIQCVWLFDGLLPSEVCLLVKRRLQWWADIPGGLSKGSRSLFFQCIWLKTRSECAVYLYIHASTYWTSELSAIVQNEDASIAPTHTQSIKLNSWLLESGLQIKKSQTSTDVAEGIQYMWKLKRSNIILIKIKLWMMESMRLKDPTELFSIDY